MATGQLHGVLRNLRRIARWRDSDRLSDAELLDCFISHNDESAFEGLLRRHGPMVFGVCRRVLGNTQDAEDAFQAAFLVLARKAASVCPREMIGNWLYGVAYRTALKARSMIARRRAHEKQVLEMPDAAARPEADWSDLQPRIDQELNRLADKYRVPVVLCDLEGKSQRAAARQLGWPEGTLMTRLSRARLMLAKRLSRQGIALSAAALATLLAQNAAAASLPMTLTSSTIKAATLVTAGQAATVVSAEVAALTEGVLSTMFVAKIKSAAICLFVVAFLGSGAGLFTRGSMAERALAAEPTPAGALVKDADHEFTALLAQERGGRDSREPPSLSAKIVGVAKDGKSITVETPSPNRGEGPVKHEIKLDDKTELKFFGVGPDGAKLVEGLLAQIWSRGDAKDSALRLYVYSAHGRLAADFSGKLTGVSKDGSTLTFETMRRDENARTTEIKLTIKTMLTYSNIAKGGTKPTVGYAADVWLERGSKTDAVEIRFHATDGLDRGRGVPQGTLSSRQFTLSQDGKVITMELPPQERGGEGSKVDIKIDDKTRLLYHNVAPGGDQPSEGYIATVLLAEGSKDTAAAISFLAPHKDRLRTLRGQVMGVGKDGKSFTIEIPPTERGQAPEQVTIKITEHTRVVYNGVGLNGARLTEGYSVLVSLDEGSKDAAFHAVFGPPAESGRR
jgi:RNA polymerase sigma factor (sigma-70 family)